MTPETILQAKILRHYGSRGDVRLFRNEVGVGWVGTIASKTPNTVTLVHPRRVSFGLHPGSSDLIGWHRRVITPEMVGFAVAIFTGVEIKTDTGRLKPNQQNWDAVLRLNGGVSIVARTTDPIWLDEQLVLQPEMI